VLIFLIGLGAFGATAVGGLVALRVRARMHLVLGFSAGVLLALVGLDLLPEVLRLTDGTLVLGVPAGMLGFVGGYLFLPITERVIALRADPEAKTGGHGHVHPAVGVVGAVALSAHSFLDGLGIGLAFQVNTTLGVAVAIAVLAHDFTDGINTVTVMLVHRNTRRRAGALLACDALAPVLGILSTLLLPPLPEFAVGIYLGYFAGFLLSLVSSSILPEAHARGRFLDTLLATFTGIGVIWTVVSLG